MPVLVGKNLNNTPQGEYLPKSHDVIIVFIITNRFDQQQKTIFTASKSETALMFILAEASHKLHKYFPVFNFTGKPIHIVNSASGSILVILFHEIHYSSPHIIFAWTLIQVFFMHFKIKLWVSLAMEIWMPAQTL